MLTETEAAVLDFAGRTYRYQGTRETAVREAFGWSLTRYHQVLDALLDRPAALAHAPQTVNRLRRLRDARRAARSSHPVRSW